ncbi:MAG: glycosyltransferase family A protein, partial [Pseudomonadota bacterium]
MTYDITAIVTAHNETVLAGPTMRSAEAAIAEAEAAGLRVERLIGLDEPTPGARVFFEQPEFADWRVMTMSYRDQGKARNHLAALAEGSWIAFLDADDLWSENWLTAAFAQAGAHGSRKVIVHPELNWFFDRQATILANVAQDSPFMAPAYFYVPIRERRLQMRLLRRKGERVVVVRDIEIRGRHEGAVLR